MRTTLDIADDVLFAAKEIAQREKKPVGFIISELARRAFATTNSPTSTAVSDASTPGAHVAQQLASYGITPLAPRGGVVSNELIDRLRDTEGI